MEGLQKMSSKEFRRIAKATSGMSEICTAWLFPDHLISVVTYGWHEQYRRFHFKDIRGISLNKTKSWIVTNVSAGVIAGIFALTAIVYTKDADTRPLGILYAILFGVAITVILFNTLAGPTCTCTIHTRVSAHKVDAIKRFRKGRKFIDLVTPLIMNAQPHTPPSNSILSSEQQPQPEPQPPIQS